jgi:hypothetical protein
VGTIGLAYYEAAVSELSTVEGLGVGFAQASRGFTTGKLLCMPVVSMSQVVVCCSGVSCTLIVMWAIVGLTGSWELLQAGDDRAISSS